VCEPSAPNLVKNPGFESVSSTPFMSGLWYVFESTNTNAPFWTRRNNIHATTGGNFNHYAPAVATGSMNAFPAAYQGSKLAWLLGYSFSPSGYQGLVGTLSTATTPGATYVLSARVREDRNSSGGAIEMRLRRASDGAETTQAVQAPVNDRSDWVLISGPVTANANYDRVLLRFYQGAGQGGYIDDVRVCLAAKKNQIPGWVLVAGIGLAGLLVIIVPVLAWRRRRGISAMGELDG
jgi:hypothetical protein